MTPNTNSAGSAASGKRELDSHYLMAKTEYDACIASVGIQPGWRVLDAGCGTGTFLPHIAKLVGPTGSVVALDHAQDSIDLVHGWIASEHPAAAIEAHVGGFSPLPYPDASFDCIWNANVLIYLDDEQFDGMLSDFARVLKPGGLLAIKEIDYTTFMMQPIELALLWRLWQASGPNALPRYSRHRRFSLLGRHLRAHGLVPLRSQSTLVERAAPLDPTWLPFLCTAQRAFAAVARSRTLSEADHAAWADIDANIETILTDPDARYREVFTLFVGQKAH